MGTATVDPRPTGEVVVAELLGQSGRRSIDWRAFFTLRAQVAIWFWLFGWLLDERHKPSCSRVGATFWTWVGWKMVQHELWLVAGQLPISNAMWTAWYAVEGMFILAVFGPRVASYFGPGAAGAIAAGTIATATRDKLAVARRLLAQEAGHVGTEYDDSNPPPQ